jgi:hypothetical protein
MGDGGLARIRNDLVQDLIKNYGKNAYTHALERMDIHEGDEFMVAMWRSVVKELDEYFKGEE